MTIDHPSLDELRDDVRRSSLCGSPMMLAAGVAWIFTAVATFFLPLRVAALVTLFQGCISMPLGLWLLPAWLKLPALPRQHPMIPLLVQCALVQTAALPALILLYNFAPAYLPVAMASVVGAHFLPYAWIQRFRGYAIAAAVIPAGSCLLALVLREQSFHVTGFFTGAVLLALAGSARASARA